MAKKPELPKPMNWSICKLAAKAVRRVEAPDDAIAIENALAGRLDGVEAIARTPRVEKAPVLEGGIT